MGYRCSPPARDASSQMLQGTLTISKNNDIIRILIIRVRNITVAGHKTLWIPTKKKNMKLNKDKSVPTKRRPTSNKVYRYHHQQQITPGTTTLKYWHHFYEDEEAWPKVVLILSSTERTTTAKPQTKTFANYFPSLYKPEDSTESDFSSDSTEEDREESSEEDREEEREKEREEEQENSERTEEDSPSLATDDGDADDSGHEDDNYRDSEFFGNDSQIFRFDEDRATNNPETTTTTPKSRRSKVYTTVSRRITTTRPTTTTTTKAPTTTKSTKLTRTRRKTTVDTATYETYGEDLTTTTTPGSPDGDKGPGEEGPGDESDDGKTPGPGDTTTRPTTTRSTTTRPTTTRPTTMHTTTPKPLEARCFQCGLNTSEIPYAPSCHHVFDTPDRTFHSQRRFYKVICKNEDDDDRVLKSREPVGDINDYYVVPPDKTYRGGCFKRFLDLGELYNERGCRTMLPLRGNSLASIRLMRLERSMAAIDEGCVSSPHASLTPFSKAVSLYSRYHVCVCIGEFCNRATTHKLTTFYVLFLIIHLKEYQIIFLF
ncbi:uncharacterized protein LOC113499987 [Trichoplusia ni]|uniref:Uncharacterized protein LOC113499987 n=1 Tax=Trichoplusia ni TaxID=7111 RepID=A0A7E5W7F9_TRINI|nr:uncharacterized protein LOC113499987 [Trichoplusia ni]